jgi:hypothetical protein
MAFFLFENHHAHVRTQQLNELAKLLATLPVVVQPRSFTTGKVPTKAPLHCYCRCIPLPSQRPSLARRVRPLPKHRDFPPHHLPLALKVPLHLL